MAVLGWGKPTIAVKDLDVTDAEWELLPTPVEGSTELVTTKGDKQEAKVEGGENEDVRYGKNTYALNLNIRAAKGRKKPINDHDGVVAHNYAIAVQAEDPEAQGVYISKARVSVEDTWSTAEGGIWQYAFDALKPDEEGKDQAQIGVVTITKGADGKVTDVTVTEEE